METQKIINLLNNSENEYSKFATKKWYVIDSESKSNYPHENPTATPNAATQVVFKNCAPFEKCNAEINETFIVCQILLILQCLCTI